MNEYQFVTVRRYHDPIVAELMMAALHNAGIRTFKLDETSGSLPTGNVEIKVLESDVDYALEVIEYQENL